MCLFRSRENPKHGSQPIRRTWVNRSAGSGTVQRSSRSVSLWNNQPGVTLRASAKNSHGLRNVVSSLSPLRPLCYTQTGSNLENEVGLPIPRLLGRLELEIKPPLQGVGTHVSAFVPRTALWRADTDFLKNLFESILH